MSSFTTVELAMIRVVVADQAAGYYGGPLHLGESDAARYVSEGHLRELCDQHGLREVWPVVAEAIKADPAALTRTKRERDDARSAREARCEGLADDVLVCLQAGDYDDACALIDEAELIDPTYQVGKVRGLIRTYTWTDIRGFIARKQEASR